MLLAHGLVEKTELPIPESLFGWAAAAVLVVSFVSLASLWPQPRLEEPRERALPRGLSRVLASPALDAVCGTIGLAVLGLVLWAGFVGENRATANIAPTIVYALFWVGFVFASVLFGDVFRVFNPWRAGGRLVGRVLPLGGEPLPYPARLGYWPAAVGLLGFAWLELASTGRERPQTVATAALVYSVVTWAAMGVYGVEAWSRRGEAFGVYFGLFARIAPLARRGREIVARAPLADLAQTPLAPGLVAVLAVMIGSVSFDGFSAGDAWQDVQDPLVDLFGGGGKPGPIEAAATVGLIGCVLIVGLLYLAAARPRAREFAPTLVPIAFAYVGAHYVSLLVYEVQDAVILASDPLGRGSDVFGTATWRADLGVVGAEAYWYIWVVLVVCGHLAAVVSAHDKALVLLGDARTALRSQLRLLAVMVGFTVLALWLLAGAREG